MSINSSKYEKLSSRIGMFHNSTNIGFFTTGDEIYLIDTGDKDSDGKELISTLKELFPDKKISGIFNTHSHADHCGGNSYILKTLADENRKVKVWASEYENLIMQFPFLMATLMWGGNAFEELKDQNYIAKVKNPCDEILTEAKIEFEDVCVQGIMLPGHYFNQAGILVTDKIENKTAFFLGDGFFGSSMLKKFWMPFMYDPEQFRQSVEKIKNTPSDFYVPSHGEIYTPENISAAAELNTIVTYEFETLILNLLKKNPVNQEELLKQVADYAELKLKTGNYILIGTTMRSYLSSLNRRGLVDYEIIDNRLIWKYIKSE